MDPTTFNPQAETRHPKSSDRDDYLRTRFVSLYRPLTVQEIIDDAITMYREGFWTLIGLSALPWIPLLVLYLLLLFPVLYFSVGRTTPEEFGVPEVILLLFSFLFLAVFVLVQGFQNGLVSLAGSGYLLGQRPTIRQVLSAFKPSFTPLLANQILASLVLAVFYGAIGFVWMLGLIALMAFLGLLAPAGGVATAGIAITAIFIYAALLIVIIPMGVVWVALMPQIIVLEGKSFTEAFDRNIALVRKQFWRAMGCYMVFGFVQFILTFAFFIVTAIIIGLIIGLIAIYYDLEALLLRWGTALNYLSDMYSFLSGILVMPPLFLCNVLLYYDLRFRTEGLDVHLMMQRQAQ